MVQEPEREKASGDTVCFADENDGCIVLANKVKIPAIGFGGAFGQWTSNCDWKGFTPEQGWEAFPLGLKSGYRHFDLALFYGTHRIFGYSLGQALAGGHLKRTDVFITSKVFHPSHPVGLNHIGKSINFDDPELDISKLVRQQIEMSLDELMVGYIDLMLMHWPGPSGYNVSIDVEREKRMRKEAWGVLEEYYKLRKLKAIGVSNFQKHHIEEIMETANVKPMVNQIEISPYMTQPDLVEYLEENEIIISAYAPFGSGATGVLSDPVIKRIAESHSKSTGQIVLRWLVQRNIVALPRSTNEKRMRSNLDIFDFTLDTEEMAQISSLNKNHSSLSK